MSMRIDVAALDHAVEGCFKAMIDSALWPSVLGEIGEAAASTGAVMFISGGRDSASFLSSASCAGAMDWYLSSDWSSRNPRLDTPPGEKIYSDADFMLDERQARNNAAFRGDFLRKFDMGWFAGASLYKDKHRQVLISVERAFGRGAFEADELHIINEGFRRMRRLLALAPALDSRLRIAVLEGFESRKQAAAIIDGHGLLLHFNHAAEKLIASVLRIRHRHLYASAGNDGVAWNAFVDRLVSSQPGAERVPDPIVLTSSEGARILVRGQPLPSESDALFRRAAALVFFDDLTPQAIPPDELRAIFGLTHAEARLASQLAVSFDLGGAGRTIGIGHETARSHLKKIFAKTNTTCQAECIAKLMQLRLLR